MSEKSLAETTAIYTLELSRNELNAIICDFEFALDAIEASE